MDNKQLIVGIADMKLCRLQGALITYALGSCVGICLYDPFIKLAGMVHILLPENVGGQDPNLFKYADTGIKETVRRMMAFGALKPRITAKIAGGARMFEIQGGGSIGNIGERNAASVKNTLNSLGIKIIASDCGLNYARTMSMDAETGMVIIRSFGKPDKKF